LKYALFHNKQHKSGVNDYVLILHNWYGSHWEDPY